MPTSRSGVLFVLTMVGRIKTLIVLQALKDHGLSPGYFTEKYASKKDVERQKRQEKAGLPQKKRNRLVLKQDTDGSKRSCRG